jgi:hypothetical protein
MKPKDVVRLHGTIQNEGFDQAFVDYSDFKEVEDAEFHAKRKAYLQARKDLADYIGCEEEAERTKVE